MTGRELYEKYRALLPEQTIQIHDSMAGPTDVDVWTPRWDELEADEQLAWDDLTIWIETR
jgi:hypothetical protein